MTKREAKSVKVKSAIAAKIATPKQLRKAIARLSPRSPFTDEFRAKWRARKLRGGQQERAASIWYESQHEHWLGWLKQYDGPGAYDRIGRGYSAEFAYNHIVNAQMLIYLGEAVGIDRGLLRIAAKAALASMTMSSMAGAIRRVLPWEVVERALVARG